MSDDSNKNNNNNLQEIDDPYMGLEDEDDAGYLGAGENSLFGGYLDNNILDAAIDSALNAAIDPALGGPQATQVHNSGPTTEPAPDGTSIPQVLAAQTPSSQNTSPHDGGPADPAVFALPEGQSLYPLQPLQGQPSTGPYGVGPQQAQDNNQLAAGGQGQFNISPPNNSAPFGMPPALSGGMQQVMPQQLMPQQLMPQQQVMPQQLMPQQQVMPQQLMPQQQVMPQQLMPQQLMQQGQVYTMPNPGFAVFNPPQQHMAAPMQGFSTTPGSAPYTPPVGKKLAHNRRLKHGPGNDPSQVYRRPLGFRSWGPLVGPRQPHHLFQYSKSSAELKPAAEFTKEQLITFFLGTDHPNPGQRRLTLWIQNTPAQSNDRYVNGSSSGKCRYKHCRGGSHTILKGWFRVAFDEYSDQTGRTLDPFHNAGYMHLHCFETLFDLGYLIHHGAAHLGFSIRPDTRDFPHETRNPASITRDHHEMIEAYDEWVKRQQARADAYAHRNNIRPEDYYTGLDPEELLPHPERLGAALTNKHLSLEVKGRSANRDRRGGVNIGMHRGDLDEYNRLRYREALRKRQEAQSAEHADDDGAGSGDAAQPQAQGTRGRSPQHGTKRKRSSKTPGRHSTPSRHSPEVEGPSTKRPRHDDSINVATPGGGTDHNDNTGYEDIDAWFNDNVYDASPVRDVPQAPQAPPSPPSPPQHIGPRTRKRSRETGENIVDMLTSQQHLTRSAAHQAQAQLEEVPQHVQDQVLAAVPEYAAPLLIPARHEYNDDLEQRLGRLSKRQRREVDHFVQKQEERGDNRKPQSF
ncbi:hypothetical protein MFIFM68171_10274 [Madurella fahalii]|uniref:Uncharacterized protein n=1 Tax=Madurella fahalii TaxID=1157608 RepID=A0ABQ0GQS1_9PEZI